MVGGLKVRVTWKYVEVLGGLLTLFGTLAILPGCPYFILFAYGPCDLSSLDAEIGVLVASVGAILILAGEVGRRTKPTPSTSL